MIVDFQVGDKVWFSHDDDCDHDCDHFSKSMVVEHSGGWLAGSRMTY